MEVGFVSNKGRPPLAGLFPEIRLRQIDIFLSGCEKPESIVYCAFGSICIISGITNNYGGTDFWAEEFILEVARQRRRLPDDLIFNDFQTAFGVKDIDMGNYVYRCLDYKYDEVNGKVTIYSRKPVLCPFNVFEVFKNYTGPLGRVLH